MSTTPSRPPSTLPARTAVLVAISGAILTAASPVRVEAQFVGALPVVDAGAIAQLVNQVARQVQAIGVARDQLRHQVENMRKLSSPPWRGIATAQAQIDVLTRQGTALSYALADLDAQFRSTFPGWRTHSDLRAATREQNERTLATLRGVLNASSATAQQLSVSSATLNAMKDRVASITTAQQAGELNGAIGILTAEELALLRQQLAMQANVHAVTLANQVNRDLQGAAAAAAFEESGARAPVARPRRSASTLGWAP